jgi:hypothetical protein
METKLNKTNAVILVTVVHLGSVVSPQKLRHVQSVMFIVCPGLKVLVIVESVVLVDKGSCLILLLLG